MRTIHQGPGAPSPDSQAEYTQAIRPRYLPFFENALAFGGSPYTWLDRRSLFTETRGQPKPECTCDGKCPKHRLSYQENRRDKRSVVEEHRNQHAAKNTQDEHTPMQTIVATQGVSNRRT